MPDRNLSPGRAGVDSPRDFDNSSCGENAGLRSIGRIHQLSDHIKSVDIPQRGGGHAGQHSERLAAYWAEALSGPSDYTESMGDQSSVLRMHSGNGEHLEMDERAQTCFAQALDDAGFPDERRLRSTLKAYFRWATAEVSARPESADDVPPGLPLARWSWDGPV